MKKLLPDISFAKVPPHNLETERAALGCVLMDKNTFDILGSLLTAECFYTEQHQVIFKAMEKLHLSNRPIDYYTVNNALLELGCLDLAGGTPYLIKLSNCISSPIHSEEYARIIFQNYLQRQIILVGGILVTKGYDYSNDVFETLDLVEQQLYSVTGKLRKKDIQKVDALAVRSIQKIVELQSKQDSLTGVPSGFVDIDKITHGWQATDLIIVAARPSVGKTAFALNIAAHASIKSKIPTALFSLEMSSGQLINRVISSESEIHLDKIMKGRVGDEDLKTIYESAIKNLGTAPFYIDDTAALNIFELRAKARRLKNQNNIGLIIIDYLQLMSGSGERSNNREQDISNISRGLKALAKELEIPIIALSQLSREVEKRTVKRPLLSDLRESGAIEQDADLVIFLYEDDESQTRNIRIAKNRNGTLDNIKLTAKLYIQKFVDYEGTKANVVGIDKKRPLPSSDYKALSAGDIMSNDPEELPF